MPLATYQIAKPFKQAIGQLCDVGPLCTFSLALGEGEARQLWGFKKSQFGHSDSSARVVFGSANRIRVRNFCPAFRYKTLHQSLEAPADTGLCKSYLGVVIQQ